MKRNSYFKQMIGHPLEVLYGVLLGFVAFSAAVPMLLSGSWDTALADLAMAAVLIWFFVKNCVSARGNEISFAAKCAAWGVLAAADILALLPTQNLSGSLTAACAFALLICSFALFFNGVRNAVYCMGAAMWCCVFMPYHEEIMLLLSFPLRLSATVLSSGILNLVGAGVVHSGTSLTLPDMNIAITDACSGIRQLDAFLLIAFAMVQLLHRKVGWKVLHFAFIVPSVIVGNTLRIVLTVLLYRIFGEVILQNTWHTVLGYVQIILALLIFLGIGRIFAAAGEPQEETKA